MTTLSTLEPCLCGHTIFEVNQELLRCQRCGRHWLLVRGDLIYEPDMEEVPRTNVQVADRLTVAQKNKYLRGDGMFCPFCGSDNTEAQEIDVDFLDLGSGNDVRCVACHETWQDWYTLTHVFAKIV